MCALGGLGAAGFCESLIAHAETAAVESHDPVVVEKPVAAEIVAAESPIDGTEKGKSSKGESLAYEVVKAVPAWEPMSDDEGIKTYRRSVEGESIVSFRGEAIIDAPIWKVMGVLSDTSRKVEWVAKVKVAEDLEQISKYERIEYNHTAVPWPFQDRDFVYHIRGELLDSSKAVRLLIKSVEHKGKPKTDGVVRGHVKEGNYLLTSLQGGKRTKLEVEITADPRGAIPHWLVNLFQKSWPRVTIEGIRRQVAKADVADHADIRNHFLDLELRSTVTKTAELTPGTAISAPKKRLGSPSEAIVTQ